MNNFDKFCNSYTANTVRETEYEYVHEHLIRKGVFSFHVFPQIC